MSLRILPLIALMTTPAFADQPCLTADALKTGVRVTVKDGSEQVYRAKGRDVIDLGAGASAQHSFIPRERSGKPTAGSDATPRHVATTRELPFENRP